jgi:sigma-B regulation protein RsbU (phosphoserine phosphatase)
LLPSGARLAEKEKRYGLIIRQVFEPCSQLGGDFWGTIPIDDRRVGVFICDFAGHGVGAAMNTFQLHTLLERLPVPDPRDPAAFVHLVNQSLCANLNGRQYATFLFAILDLSTDRLRYAAGASPNPIVGRRGTTATSVLQGAGVPLGLWAEATYENHEIDFPDGSFLFLFSDALTEAPLLDGSLLGTDGVRALVVEKALAAAPDQALTSILAGMDQPLIGSGLEDDLTMVWIERGRDSSAPEQQKAGARS